MKITAHHPQGTPCTPHQAHHGSSSSSSSSSSTSGTTGGHRVAAALRCPASPVMRAKEGFFQLLREKKREFDARLDYEFLWLRELREEVEHSDHLSACSLLPATSTATYKRQRLLIEARESLHAPAAPSSPVFVAGAATKRLLSPRKKPTPPSAAPSPGAFGRPSPYVPASRLGTTGTTRGRRGGSIIKALFTDAAASKGVEGTSTRTPDRDKGKEKVIETSNDEHKLGTKIGMHKLRSENKENADANKSIDETSVSPSCRLFVPPSNAWSRSPSPVKKINGKGVIAVRVRKTPLSLRQQSLKKRARELGRVTPTSPEANTPTREASSPRQELLLTEDGVAMVVQVDPADEASPGVTADCDIDMLREELNAEKLAKALEGSLIQRTEPSNAAKSNEKVTRQEPPEPLTTALMLARIAPNRSDSWFSLGTDLSEVEIVVPPSVTRKLCPEVNRGTVRDTDIEKRSTPQTLTEVIGTQTTAMMDEPEQRKAPTNAVEEERIESNPLLTDAAGTKPQKHIKEIKPEANTPFSQRKSRLLEREERLRQIDKQREEIKRRREERERRRRESELGSVIVHDVEQKTPDYLAGVFRQTKSAEESETKATKPRSPESLRRHLLAQISPPSFDKIPDPTSPVSCEPSATTCTQASGKAKEPAARKRVVANLPSASARSTNITISPTAALRRKMREKSVRLKGVTPHVSTLSPSIQERLKQGTSDANASPKDNAPVVDERGTRSSPVGDDPTPKASPSPPAPTPARVEKEATPAVSSKSSSTTNTTTTTTTSDIDDAQAEDSLLAKGCETVLALSSLKEKKLVDAFLEAISKHKREREDREREEKRSRGTVAPFPIPSPGSPSSSFIVMGSSGKRSLSMEPCESIVADRLRSASAPICPVITTSSSSSSSPSSSSSSVPSEGSPPKKRKLEDGGSVPSTAVGELKEQTIHSAIPEPTAKKTWRGEGEGTLRMRQLKEKKENGQRLYGLDAELARKAEEKLRPEQVRRAVMWVYKAARGDARGSVLTPSSDRGAPGLFDCLKSGRLLCEVANKIRPGIIPKIHVRPIPLMEQENLKMYLAACERMGMKKADLFVVSDLYEEKYLPAVLQNIISLSRFACSSSSFDGPRVQL